MERHDFFLGAECVGNIVWVNPGFYLSLKYCSGALALHKVWQTLAGHWAVLRIENVRHPIVQFMDSLDRNLDGTIDLNEFTMLFKKRGDQSSNDIGISSLMDLELIDLSGNTIASLKVRVRFLFCQCANLCAYSGGDSIGISKE